jgi:hypothetical protein
MLDLPVETNSFTKYKLSDESVMQATQFSAVQQALMQNIIADNAELKIGLKFNPLEPHDFLQQEAYLTGQIDAIRYLLSLSQTNVPSQE